MHVLRQVSGSLKADRFSARQYEAISSGEGTLLIVAGPGSGKTTVLTARIEYIIRNLQADPGSILVMTFSRAAAAEMKERFLSTGASGADKVCFGTFHSVFYRVLRTAYGKLARNYIFDDEAQDRIRFDEMLSMTEELLREREDICRQIRKKYRWILIDEFQDIDDLQFEIVKLIAPPGENPNLTVVGDDDQSIYAFRGANPKIMLDFEKTYPGTRKVILDINFRSGGEITGAALRLIERNKNRFSKSIISYRGCGASVRIYEFENVRDEYMYAVSGIKDSVRHGCRPENIAVLHRNNMQPWEFGHLLHDSGIEGVRLMTFHKSKGLEFSEVWIIDADDGVTPDIKAVADIEMEEERRVFYVAMTRARDRLNICRSSNYKNRIMRRSRFIDEIIRGR